MDMKKIQKWVIALAPFLFMGCSDTIETTFVPAKSGDDVQFAVAKNLDTPQTRTKYDETQWDETTTQAIYWGNYMSGKNDTISIYCPDNPERGFAKYHVNPVSPNSNVAETIVKTGDIGVQWGASGKPYTFYAFYPADKASTTLVNGNTIHATLKPNQSPVIYKHKAYTETDYSKLTEITSFKDYNASQLKEDGSVETTASTIYGNPDMEAAVMVARKTMSADEFGWKVPLQFNVLADVLDITINGPVKPNSLNGNSLPVDQAQADYIQIQAVTIEVVDLTSEGSEKDPSKYKVDVNTPISGTFDLNMSQEAFDNKSMVSKVEGDPFVQIQTSKTNADGGVYYPTLFVRADIANNASPTPDQIDHLRLRAFLIPGQITNETLNKLRVHVQTNCGDYYKMLKSDTGDNEGNGGFVSGQIYPIKLNYFKKAGESFNLTKWVGQLDPDIYLSELSIPGAWHASNSENQGDGVGLKDLYNAGVRAFEVHTINGTEPYTDKSFGTKLTSDNVKNMEFYDDHLDEYSKDGTPTPLSGSGTYSRGNRISTNNYNYTGTGYTVKQTRVIGYQQLPKFALRLYRSRNITNSTDNPTESFSDAIISLANDMNKDGLMFLEIGYEAGYTGDIERPVYIPCRTMTKTQTRTKYNCSLTGTGPYFSSESDITWNTDNVFTDDDQWEDDDEGWIEDYSNTYTMGTKQAWCIAVESCLNRLKETPNTATEKPAIIYTTEITPETTVRNVQGYIIAKVNTNDASNEKIGIGWSGNTPALFSRWMDGSGSSPLAINLEWGKPVAPYDGGESGNPNTQLRWCYTELEKVESSDVLQKRKDAIVEMNALAAKNYSGNLHRTFYETSVGGFYLENNATGKQNLAKELNPYLLGRVTNPSRQAVPLGLVFMNYCVDPNNSYRSAELIRAIINNNRAFRLHRITDGK